jgi:Tfp pilus assembly protein PilX
MKYETTASGRHEPEAMDMKTIRGIAGDERGMALILVLVMMLLISLLGTVIFTTSTTEVQISRNYRLKESAFYAAERAMEYAQADSAIYNVIGDGAVQVNRTTADVTDIEMTVDLTVANDTSDASASVEYLTGGNPPRNSGVDVTQYMAHYYLVNATGTGAGNSSAEIEAVVAEILPRPNP